MKSRVDSAVRWSKSTPSRILFWCVVALVGNVAGAALLGTHPVANASIGIASTCVGVLLSFVMFLRSDDDMRGLKTLLLGALSGTGLAKSDEIAAVIGRQYASLSSPSHGTQQLAQVFFFAVCAGLLGILGGFLALRLGLEGQFMREQRALTELLGKVPIVPLGPAPELDEFWPQVRGNLPDEETIEKLAKISDWAAVPSADALRAAAVFIEKKRWDDALRTLDHFVRQLEPPSPMAFDLYACALVGQHGWKPFDATAASVVDRLGSRMLSYWGQSFLVNLDLGYLYLYVPGKSELAEHYTRRAVGIRPESRAANLNLANALAQRHGTNASDKVVDEIIQLLGLVYPGEKPDPARFNEEGDFTPLLSNPRFAKWISEA